MSRTAAARLSSLRMYNMCNSSSNTALACCIAYRNACVRHTGVWIGTTTTNITTHAFRAVSFRTHVLRARVLCPHYCVRVRDVCWCSFPFAGAHSSQQYDDHHLPLTIESNRARVSQAADTFTIHMRVVGSYIDMYYGMYNIIYVYMDDCCMRKTMS